MSKSWETFMSISFLVMKIFGLAPMSRHKNPMAKNPFHTSYKGLAYNVIFLIFYILIHVFFMIFDDLLDADSSDIIFALSNFYVVISFLVVCVTIFTFVWKHRIVTEMINEFHQINLTLEIFDENYRQKKLGNKLQWLMGYNMFCCLLFPIASSLTCGIHLQMSFILTNSILVSWIVFEYVWMVAIMDAMIETINDRFQQIEQSNPLLVQTIGEEKSKITSLEVLQNNCLKFMDTSTKFSDFYGTIMLGCVLKFFFSILTDLFFIIRPALLEKRFIIVSYLDAFLLLWLLWDVFLLATITSCITRLTTEVSF